MQKNKLKFQSDKIFFWSDLHFFHLNILKYQPNRAFKDVQEMNQIIINNWNEKAPEDSITFLLGDIALGGKTKADELAKLLSQVKSKIYLIPGNHDNYLFDNAECMKYLTVLFPLVEISVIDDKKHQNIVLCHFPLLSWHKAAEGSFHLFGHCHGNLKINPGLSMDVGFDTSPHPYSFSDIKKIMASKKIEIVDHHNEKTTY